ncbi:hypothetical protein ACQEVY_26465 [Streptomyces sp. CA-288835]|uniref:hypothetical protein n=1 Tax=Streptomyces sp. CA-288835 TaxID=3240069 RepID=UPI003D8BE64B
MRLWTASLLLRLPLGELSRPGRWALETVLRAADSGEPTAVRALGHVISSKGHEAVWSAWLRPSVSGAGTPVRRWDSPVLAELGADVSTIPGWVVALAWNTWLNEADPDAALWSRLKKWNLPAGPRADYRTRAISRLALGDDKTSVDSRLLVDTALRFDHPVGELARTRLLALSDAEAVDLYCAAAIGSRDATEFCIAHHLAPADEVQRAAFFVRTGQQEQYEAQDPDGTLLGLAYRSASAEDRAELRRAMTALSGIDTLRVLAGQRSERQDFVAVSAGERRYLVRQLRERGEWDRLWRLVPLMTLPEAVATVRVFGRWRPSAAEDHELFEALRTANPAVVNDGLSAVSSMPSRIEPIPVTLGGDLTAFAVHALDFSSDGRQVAFVASLQDRRFLAGVVDVHSNEVSQLHTEFPHRLTHVVHVGPDTVIVAEDYSRAVGPADGKKLYHADDRGVRALDFRAGRYCGLERVAGDLAFMVGTERRSFAEFDVFIGAGDGPLTQSRLPSGMYGWHPSYGKHPWVSAVHPDGRLIAALGPEDVVVADLADGRVNRLEYGRHGTESQTPSRESAFSPSALVRISRSGALSVWHDPLTTGRTPATAQVWTGAPLWTGAQWYRDPLVTGLSWSPSLHRFLTVNDGHLEILAVPPTADTPMPHQLIHERIELVGTGRVQPPCARLSPKGNVLAVAGEGTSVNLYDLTPQDWVASRTMGALRRHDLAEVTRLQRYPGLGHTARQALDLLSACLIHRFQHDIGIGDEADTAVLSDYDIALGGDGYLSLGGEGTG